MRRPAALLALAVAALVAFPSAAFAWRTGPNGGAGFGTHEWIVTQAARMAAEQGSTWVNVSVASAAADEPDKNPRDRYYHYYDRWGRAQYGNAPTRISSLYASAVTAYRSGDTTAASRYVGLLSHYYTDVCDPLHTDGSPGSTRLKRTFESRVDALVPNASAHAWWARFDGYQHVTSAKSSGISAAKTAHLTYSLLNRRLKSRGFSPSVASMSRVYLNRASNGVADMIMSIEQDAVSRSISPNLSAHQGVASNGSEFWVIHTTWIARFSPSWQPITRTDTPTAGLGLARPHLGDGAYCDGKLYVPAENWPDPSHPYLLVFDAATLSREATVSLTATDPVSGADLTPDEVAGVTIAPDEGANGVIYVASFINSSRLMRFDLKTFARLPDLRLSPTPRTGIQGITTMGGVLYAAVGPGGGLPGYLYQVAADGSTRPIFIERTKGVHEGIEADGKGDILWLVDDSGVRSHVYRLDVSVMR